MNEVARLMAAPWDWPWPWNLLSILLAVLIAVGTLEASRWSAIKTARYRERNFAEFELKPSEAGWRTYIWHRIRLHTVDYHNRAPRGGQFYCLNCGVKWWW